MSDLAITTNARLGEIAEAANAGHAAIEITLKKSLAQAVEVGDLLIEAKHLVGHGEWLPWLAANCVFSERTAQNYMRIASKYPELAKAQPIADLTYRAAIGLLAEPKADTPSGETWADLLALAEGERVEGQTVTEINANHVRAERDAGIVLNHCDRWWDQGLGWLVDYLLTECTLDIIRLFIDEDKRQEAQGHTLAEWIAYCIRLASMPKADAIAEGLRMTEAGEWPYAGKWEDLAPKLQRWALDALGMQL